MTRIGAGSDAQVRAHTLTVARAVEDYVGGLILCQGRYAGEPLGDHLQAWQRRFIRGAFSQDDDAAVTVARGAGKTTLTAAIASAALDGPLVEPMAESVVVAGTFEQALLVFRHVLAFLGPVIDRDTKRWRVQDSVNRASLEDRASGAKLKVIGANARAMHGLAPKLLILDELAQWQPTTIDACLAALTTSRGKIPGSRTLYIGTRPASDSHPFAQALDGGVGYAQVHAARPDDPPFRRSTWKRANPGLDDLPDLEQVIRREAARAKRDPALLAAFAALRLNAGTSDVVEAVLLSASTWKSIERDDVDRRGPYVLGVDCGGSAAQSAVAAYFVNTGALEAVGCFPEHPPLSERGLSDGVGRLYQDCLRRGELILAGDRVADVGALLAHAVERWGRPAVITADRFRQAELLQVLNAIGFPPAAVVFRGMGYRDGAEDVRRFRAACLDGRVEVKRSLLLRAAFAGARVVSDPSGAAKLAKATEGRRQGARDDSAAAAILAVAEGVRRDVPDVGPAYLIAG